MSSINAIDGMQYLQNAVHVGRSTGDSEVGTTHKDVVQGELLAFLKA